MSNIRFSSFLKPQLKIDTIPKPGGLGSGGPHVGCLSGLFVNFCQ